MKKRSSMTLEGLILECWIAKYYHRKKNGVLINTKVKSMGFY